jgi:hypothetical protein
MRDPIRRAALSLVGVVFLVGCGRQVSERPRYGELMAEVGRRFSLLGRAGEAGRWELAAYELDELGEVFEDLRRAEPPERKVQIDLRGLEEAFTHTHPPELAKAIADQDSTTFATAFARAAGTCNGCHVASERGFIEVPTEPGAEVPRLDPAPPASRSTAPSPRRSWPRRGGGAAADSPGPAPRR